MGDGTSAEPQIQPGAGPRRGGHFVRGHVTGRLGQSAGVATEAAATAAAPGQCALETGGGRRSRVAWTFGARDAKFGCALN